MPKVLNKKLDTIPEDAIYVGRPSKWGNPFIIGIHGNRDKVLEKYYDMLIKTPTLFNCLNNLRGKDLVCWCAPEPCHADILLELAND